MEDALPALEALSGLELPRQVERICAARFLRQARLLQLEDCCVEIALDSGVLLGNDREEAFCEVELELKSGSREALETFGRAFARRFSLTDQPKSKFARALALAQEE